MKNKFHVAIIMDGNGRWAKAQGKPRYYGHQVGAQKIGQVLEWAIQSQVSHLTLFAFSSENWNRPKLEVNFLLKLLDSFLKNKSKLKSLQEKNVLFKWIGLKDKMPPSLIKSFAQWEKETKNNTGLVLSIAFNYGGQQDLYQACQNKINHFTDLKNNLLSNYLPPVDLLIRTGNEKRISNFLLWDLAYAEIIFEPSFWPAYDQANWTKNLAEFAQRDRRFGKLK